MFITADIAAAVLIILSAVLGIFTTEGRLWMSGAYRFVFFTVDSNILAGLSALILLPFKIRRLKTGKPLPRAAITLSLISVSSVTVTFMTGIGRVRQSAVYAFVRTADRRIRRRIFHHGYYRRTGERRLG